MHGAGPGGHDPSQSQADSARETLRRLLDEADQAASAVLAEAEHVRRDHHAALARELEEIEELRHAMGERLEAANERFGTAQRIVETSRARLAEVDELHGEANRTLVNATEHAATMLAGVEAEVEAARGRARSDAEVIVRDAELEAQRIIDEAAAYQRDVELRAAETLGSAHVRVEEVIQRATARRHAQIDDLHAREEEIRSRIASLLADVATVDTLGIVPDRREPDIDLTDDVTETIRNVIDEWSARRADG
ncbi:MAG: hypothetical protein AAF081_12480 [Actinomycetota bacterium]